LALPHLHSLWVGNKLNYLERLCIASAKATGHEFTLWSYDPENLEGVPEGTNLRDAAEGTTSTIPGYWRGRTRR
jgi:hypothetical protein